MTPIISLLVAALILGVQTEDLRTPQMCSNTTHGTWNIYYNTMDSIQNGSNSFGLGILQCTSFKSAESCANDTNQKDIAADNIKNVLDIVSSAEAILLVNATVEPVLSDPSSNNKMSEYEVVRTPEELAWALDDLEYAMTHKLDHTKAIVRKQAVPFSLLDLGSFFAVVVVISIVMSFTIMEPTSH